MKSYAMWICAALVSFGIGWRLMAPSSSYELEEEASAESRSQRYLEEWESLLGRSVETRKIRYAYPDIRLHHIEILTVGGKQRLITFVSQQPALHLPALALASHARTGFLASEASAFLDEELAVQLGASLSYFGLHGEVPSRGSRRYRAIQVHRGILDPPKSAFSSLDWFLETTRLGGDYFRSNSNEFDAFLTARKLDKSPSGTWAKVASCAPSVAFKYYLQFDRSEIYDGASEGIKWQSLPQWMVDSTSKGVDPKQMETPMRRWVTYSPAEALAWTQSTAADYPNLEVSCGFWLAITHRDLIETIQNPSESLVEGVFRGLMVIDPRMSYQFLEAIGADDGSFIEEQASFLASELSYLDPDAAHAVFKKHLSTRSFENPSVDGIDFDAFKTMQRVFSSLADSQGARAVDFVDELPADTRGAALAHLAKVYTIKGDRNSVAATMSRLLKEHQYWFNTAASQVAAYGVDWDPLETIDIDDAKRSTIDRWARSVKGAGLPSIVK